MLLVSVVKRIKAWTCSSAIYLLRPLAKASRRLPARNQNKTQRHAPNTACTRAHLARSPTAVRFDHASGCHLAISSISLLCQLGAGLGDASRCFRACRSGPAWQCPKRTGGNVSCTVALADLLLRPHASAPWKRLWTLRAALAPSTSVSAVKLALDSSTSEGNLMGLEVVWRWRWRQR